jgi:hypothetical protein
MTSQNKLKTGELIMEWKFSEESGYYDGKGTEKTID